MIQVKKDLTGMIFGRLKVIKQVEDYVGSDGIHRAQWLCECSCKNHTLKKIKGANLTKKRKPTRSCGCLQKESLENVVTEFVKKKNIYSDMMLDENGYYYIGYTSNTHKEFYVDADDFNKIKDLCWCEHFPANNFSTLIAFDTSTKKNIKMHQLLGFKEYDHIDRNELNNRKYNLRPCTKQENIVNKSKRTDNTSGVIGVLFNKRANKWVSELSYKGSRWRKSFYNFDDAVRARLNAEIKYFGKFSPQKHLYEQYGVQDEE